MNNRVIDICEQPLHFVGGVAYCLSFSGRTVKVFQNQTKHWNRQYGYIIIDFNGKVLKFCRSCSVDGVKRAVILN